MSEKCGEVSASIYRVFSLLGKRWTGMVLSVLLENGSTHFTELRRAIPGISERMLSDRLTELAAAGLVVREVLPGPPVGVAYSPTERGSALRPALAELARWADCHLLDEDPAKRAHAASK